MPTKRHKIRPTRRLDLATWRIELVAGNGTGVLASGPSLHDLPASTEVVIPANGFVVFTVGP